MADIGWPIIWCYATFFGMMAFNGCPYPSYRPIPFVGSPVMLLIVVYDLSYSPSRIYVETMILGFLLANITDLCTSNFFMSCRFERYSWESRIVSRLSSC